MTFFGAPAAVSGEIGIQALGLWAQRLREASAELPLELPSLDFLQVKLVDQTGHSAKELCSRQVFVGHQPSEVLDALPDDVRVLFLGTTAEPVMDMGRSLGSGRVTACGLQHYSQAERDELRNTQRLLPAFEMDFETAIRTAGLENGECPLLVSLHLSLFDANSVPDIIESSLKGLDPKTYFSSLRHFPKEQIVAFHLWGAPETGEDRRTFNLGAEILRDSILHWWSKI